MQPFRISKVETSQQIINSGVTPDSQSVIVVCAADDGYTMPLTVTIRSVIENFKTQRKLSVFVIDGGIKKSNKRKILKSVSSENIQIEWVKPQAASLKSLKVTGHMTVATYYRLLIPEILPDWVNKAIYLDCDLIVKANLGELWDMDVKENYLLAVQDMSVVYVSSPTGLGNYKELGIPANYKYFNAGVMVINIEKWRAEKISSRIVEYLEQNLRFVRWWDQDGLNAVLAGKWGELDLKWNQQPQIYGYGDPSWAESPLKRELEEDVCKNLIDDPCIIHYATARKPWLYDSLHPRKDLFFHYLDMTAWSQWRPKKHFSETSLGKYWRELKEYTVVGKCWEKLKKLNKSAQKVLANFL